ncbi:hypothetical protein HYW67_02720 [Candidatus Parcubacteria bacterium]|nr:hypothetical protein [Candidatus Parcubacteria bacterium]
MTHATLVLTHKLAMRPAKPVARSLPVGWFTALFVVLIVGAAGTYVAIMNRVVSANYAIRRSEAQMRELQNNLKVLEVEVAEAGALTSLRAAAERQGLVPTEKPSYLKADRDALTRR